MRPVFFFALLIFSFFSPFTQVSDLFQEHALLTRDGKRVKGHANRVIAETTEQELNRDVALAHAKQISISLDDMRQRLQQVRKMTKEDQRKAVLVHQTAIEKSCEKLHEMCNDLVKELGKQNPDRLKVRKMAIDLRNEIAFAAEHHSSLKRKIGMK